MFFALLSLAHYWTSPVHPQVQIDLSPARLPEYSLFSIARIAAAYVLSLLFSLVYGYIAANNARAEKLVVPVPIPCSRSRCCASSLA